MLSGSLLGVDLKDVRSVPVGYMDTVEMYPLDFEEFAVANGVSERVLTALKNSFEEVKEVDSLIHEKMMELFRLYLIVGGMPAVVSKYLKTNNLQEVIREQKVFWRPIKRISENMTRKTNYIWRIFST